MGRAAARLIRTAKAVAAAVLMSSGVGAAGEEPELALQWTGTFERDLAHYGLTADLVTGARDSAHLIGFELVTPMFSDYAEKRRFVYLPQAAAMTFDADGAFQFPVGAVLIKTFLYPSAGGERLVETRLMFHTAEGWNGAAYQWNDAQDAARLRVAGAEVPVSWADESGQTRSTDYLVPNMNQCKMCHRETGETGPIGLKARHLNREMNYGDGDENQLTRWARLGLLRGLPKDFASVQASVDSNSSNAAVARRAETYFDINCAHCHNPDGLASHTRLDLRPVQSNPHARGILKPPTTAGNAARGRLYAVVPGDPDASFLLHRIESTRPDVRMPPVSRTTTDAAGAALIREWIASLSAVD